MLPLGPRFLHEMAVCSLSQPVRHPFKSFWTAFMHLEPSQALRSDPLCFELNSFIYSFWTLKSLTGVLSTVWSAPIHTPPNQTHHCFS